MSSLREWKFAIGIGWLVLRRIYLLILIALHCKLLKCKEYTNQRNNLIRCHMFELSTNIISIGFIFVCNCTCFTPKIQCLSRVPGWSGSVRRLFLCILLLWCSVSPRCQKVIWVETASVWSCCGFATQWPGVGGGEEAGCLEFTADWAKAAHI